MRRPLGPHTCSNDNDNDAMGSIEALGPYRVSSLTLTSAYVGDASFDEDLKRCIDAIPVHVCDETDSRSRVDQLPTGVSWRQCPITAAVRCQPRRGRRGCGDAVLSNFRNCITFRAANRVAKIFRSGSIQACGFTSVDEFHDMMESVLPIVGPAACIDESSTSIHLLVSDASLQIAGGTMHLRSFARAARARTRGGELVEFNPDEFAGVKIKLERPGAARDAKMVSVVVRAGGNVKLFWGGQGGRETTRRVDDELARLWQRVREVCAP